jgi:hypothetical protein
MNIILYKARTRTVNAILTSGVPDWSGLICKFVATKRNANRDIVINKVGNIDVPNMYFHFNYDETILYGAGRYDYEVLLYRNDYSFVKTAMRGVLEIKYPLLIDPSLGDVYVDIWDGPWDDSEIWTD